MMKETFAFVKMSNGNKIIILKDGFSEEDIEKIYESSDRFRELERAMYKEPKNQHNATKEFYETVDNYNLLIQGVGTMRDCYNLVNESETIIKTYKFIKE